MPKRVLTQQAEEYIRNNYLLQSGKSMARQFGVNPSVVQRYLKRNGLHVPVDVIHMFRINGKGVKTSSTPEEDEYMRQNYLSLPVKRIATHLNRSHTLVVTRLRQLGLVIPEEIRAQRKIDSRIQKGTTPPNKGRKQTDYMSQEAIDRTRATTFKKGHLPHNTYNEIGKITVRYERSGGNNPRPYKYICIELAKWVPLHKVMWEEVNGPVPKGHCLWFKDGDSLNVELSNLELITRKENYARNHPSKTLSDKYVANTIAWRDAELKEEILTRYPDLIHIKRAELQLRNEINNKQSEL